MLETQLVSFCVNECGHEETLLSIDWGQMLIFSGDMPESSFNFNQVAFKGLGLIRLIHFREFPKIIPGNNGKIISHSREFPGTGMKIFC